MSRSGTTAANRPRRRLRLILPLVVFATLAAIFYVGLYSGDPSKLPSALIGRSVPQFELPALEGLAREGKPVPGFSNADLAKGEVSIVNVWASWCVPCHQEHPFLTELTRLSGAPLYGLNYKDQADAARRFLGRYGNPFRAVGVDSSGRTAINWGVYGVPETFIVSGEGVILHKHVGPVSAADITEKLMPAIGRARGGS